MMRSRVGVTLLLLGVLACAPSIKQTMVPGGLSPEKRDKVWVTAVNHCLAEGFTIQMQDKESGNLVCQMSGKTTWTMRVQFTKDGWNVTNSSSDVTMNAFIGVVAEKMNKKLQEAAGM